MAVPTSDQYQYLLPLYDFDKQTALQHYSLDFTGFTLNPSPNFNAFSKTFSDLQDIQGFHILLGQGDGFHDSPLPITRENFQDLCAGWKISPKALRRRQGPENCFNYHFEEAPRNTLSTAAASTSTPAAPTYKFLNIVLQHDIIRLFCLIRYDITAPGSARCFITLPENEHARVTALLRDYADEIFASPPALASLLLVHVSTFMNNILGGLRTERYRIQTRLGITNTETRSWLARQGHHGEPDHRFDMLNVEIHHFRTSLYNAKESLSILTYLLNAHKSVLELYTDHTDASTAFQCIKDVLLTCEQHQAQTEYSDSIAESQSSMLFNMINQRDSRLNYSVAQSSRQIAAASRRDSSAMKTISILTLIFLPGTFVSAIFSTTIFNFNTDDEDAGRYGKVGSAWWIYFLCCVLLTLMTVGIWAGWMVWRLRKAAQEDRRDEEQLNRDHDLRQS
ncbi:uncharacterized protein Z518_06169 [Rhinocladiella mackenziei CBS 650.93]|uniref:Uncharacterized protein n=1 Tax=Rhinocladiella mackenziei CBS 650.93 TaxID=1442369 RepID=A0A0D2FT57_9EURO|nr:uncharacterized protein Z518_06169 [Rhinocladiella mackenziei CBS 650.93]KIX05297.1 hypothetical protein Z518_06169 [Rhinocladiella mackenziei CBS 650.93]